MKMEENRKMPRRSGSIEVWPYLSFAALLVLGGICWSYTIHFWSDVPYYDEWKNIPFVAAIAEGNSNFLSLFAAEQGHSVFLFRLGTLVETVFLGYDPRFRMFAGLVFMTATSLMLFQHYRTMGWIGSVLFTASAALIFNLANWENLLAAWLINPSATNFFMLAAILLAYKNSSLAMIFGALCSISFTNGLAIWPCLILLFWIKNNRRALVVSLLIAAALFSRAFMLIDHAPFGSQPSIVMGVYRFFAVIGLPLTFPQAAQFPTGQSFSIACGIVVCGSIGAMFLANCRKHTAPFWVAGSVVIYGLLSCALIAFGRSNLDIGQSMSSRYFATAAIVHIGLLMCIAEMRLSPRRSFAALCASAMYVFTFLASAYSESQIGPYRKQIFDNSRAAILRNV
jgi:hypothetical protein